MRGHVFISYVREDSRNVDQLQRILQRARIRVWRDTEDLRPGENWSEGTRRAITSAVAVIVCFSRASVGRETSEQREEIHQAITELRKRRDDQLWLIPVRFDECATPETKIDANRTLETLHRVDLFGDQFEKSAAELVDMIRSLGDPAHPSSGTATFPAETSAAGGFTVVIAFAVAVIAFVLWTAHSSSAQPSLAASVALPSPNAVAERMAFNHSGSMLAIGDGKNGYTYVWTLGAHKHITTFIDPRGVCVFSAAFNPAGTILAAGDYNGSTYLWNPATHHLIATLTDPHGTPVNVVAFNPAGTILAAGGNNGSTYLWNPATHHLIATLTDPDRKAVHSVTFNPRDTILAISDSNGNIYLWNLAIHEIAATLTDPGRNSVSTAVFSPTGSTLAASGKGDHIYLWNLATHKITATLTDPVHIPSAYVYAAFSPTGSRLATGTNSNNVYLWNPATHKITATLTDPHNATPGVRTVAFSASGTLIAVGDIHNVYLWRY